MTVNQQQPANPPDPFFDMTYGGDWNACIGRQGDPENYIDGYMEAAIELVAAVIDKQQYEKRDTLAMPILYNARHAVELTLKYAIDRLHAGGILSDRAEKNHDIVAHWQVLKDAPHADSLMSRIVDELKPFIDSLRGIDEDGQELRYAETQDGKKSLESKSLCDLQQVRSSLTVMAELLNRLKYRSLDLVSERRTGTFTPVLSRRDLGALARGLPPRADWDSDAFTEARTKAMDTYGLSSRRFSEALKVIEVHREMGGMIGIEFELAHLTDDHARLVMSEWSKINPPRGEDGLEIDFFKIDRAKLAVDFRARQAVEKTVADALSLDEVADLVTVYYLGRDRVPCEYYDRRLAETIAGLGEKRRAQAVHDIMAKTNLLGQTVRGLMSLGRTRLAEELKGMRPDLIVA